MGIIDVIVLATMIVSVLFALYRGLLRELLGITSWILAGLAALYTYHPILEFAKGKVDKVQMVAMIGCTVIALIILIIMTIFNAKITKSLRKSSLSGLDRILGCAFGIARASLVIILVWLFARQMILSDHQINGISDHNLSVSYINMGADWIEKLLPENIQKSMLKTTPVPAPKVPEYKNADRQSLDDMIEDIVEVEEA